MCGITGVFLQDTDCNANNELYESIGLLQHRGQDAAGIVTCGAHGRLYQCKGNGMVRDVFAKNQLSLLLGSMGVGHVRYPTAGTSSITEAQPFYVNSPYGLVSAHNGNLTNTVELKKFLDETAHRHVNTDSDSEILLNIFADNLQQTGKSRINEDDIFTAMTRLYKQVRGGYACITMIAGFGIFAFRDPNGLRPLIYGSRQTERGLDYMFASESVCLDSLGYSNFTDVAPGQCVIVSKLGISKRQCAQPQVFSPCIFEYVYLARPDSIIDGVSVYKARLAMGEALALQVIKQLGPNMDIDVVIPIPDTSRSAALQVSYKLDTLAGHSSCLDKLNGIVHLMSVKSVRRKLNAMQMEFDDSIVRGTTSREIILMAREAGAKKVYFASCSPAIRYPNVYGIDMPTRQELIAHNRTTSEIARELGADAMIFQDLKDLKSSISRFNPDITAFDTSVFTGEYVTGDIDDGYIANLEHSRSDSMRLLQVPVGEESMGLHNNHILRK